MSAVTSAQVQKCRLCAAQLATLPHCTAPTFSSPLSLYLAHCRSAVCKLYYENFILIERVGVVATLVVGTVVAVVIVVITVVFVVLVIFAAVLVIIVVDFSVVLSSAAFHIHCAHFDCVALWQMVLIFIPQFFLLLALTFALFSLRPTLICLHYALYLHLCLHAVDKMTVQLITTPSLDLFRSPFLFCFLFLTCFCYFFYLPSLQEIIEQPPRTTASLCPKVCNEIFKIYYALAI